MADREKPVANRAVADRYSKYVHALHRANISQMKPVVNTMPPATLPHIAAANRKKRRQQELERQTIIARDNRILVEKMERIRMTRNGPYAEQPYVKPSLNRESRARELTKIDKENLALYARIQARRPVLSTQDWKKHHIENELRLKNISRYEFQPRITQSDLTLADNATIARVESRRLPGITTSPSRNPAGVQRGATGAVGAGSHPPHQLQHQQPQQNTCVFSERGIRVGGIYSTLSVYERLRPFRLDFVARDEGGRSTLAPVSLPFRDLKRVFADRPDVLAPENTALLVRCVLPALWWHEQQAKFVLQLALDRIAVPSKADPEGNSDQESQLEGVPATNLRPRCLSESQTESKSAESKSATQTDGCVYEFSIKCNSLVNSPLTGECNPVVFVWKRTAKVDPESGEVASGADEKFVYVDRTECCLSSPDASFQKVVGIPLDDDDFQATLRGESSPRKNSTISTYRFDVCEMVNGQAQEVLGAADVTPNALASLVLNHFRPGCVSSPAVLTLPLHASQSGDAASKGGNASGTAAGMISITFSPPRMNASSSASSTSTATKSQNQISPVTNVTFKVQGITLPSKPARGDDYDDDFESSTADSSQQSSTRLKLVLQAGGQPIGETEPVEFEAKSPASGVYQTVISIPHDLANDLTVALVETSEHNVANSIAHAVIPAATVTGLKSGSAPLKVTAQGKDGTTNGEIIITCR